MAEGAKNVSWPWLSLLRGLGSLAVAVLGNFAHMVHHFYELWLNPSDLW